MSQSTQRSERLTSIASTLVAIAILAAGVTAHQSHSTSQDELVLFESDLRFQLERAFRHDERESARRLALLEKTMQAWRKSPRSQEDRQLLGSWLLEATIRSMPGTTKPLPSLPEFSKHVVVPAEPVKLASKPEPEPSPSTPRVAATKAPAPKSWGTTKSRASTKPREEPRLAVRLPEKPRLAASRFTERHSFKPPAKKGTIEEPKSENPKLKQFKPRKPKPKNSKPKEPSTVLLAVAHKVEEPLPTETSASDPEPEVSVGINLTELTARIAGYHNGLDQIETALLLAGSPDIKFIEKHARLLDELPRDFRFVKLYHESLTDEERQNVRPPRSMDATLTELGRLLRQVESEQNGDFLGSFDPAQRKRFEQVRKMLATIAERTQ